MIRAVLYRSNGHWTGYRAEGHSGYAEAGSDIICAAVSVLGSTCVNSLESVVGVTPILTDNREGLLAFRLPEKQEDHEGAQILMSALKQGLSDIEEQYPRYINLSIQERRK